MELLLEDSDWTVRLTAAMRAPVEMLTGLVDDPDQEVRCLVRDRLAGRDVDQALLD